MKRYWQLGAASLALCIGLASMPANAQNVLISRGSNITNGPVACTGLDTTVPVQFTGALGLPTTGIVHKYVVGADVLVQTNPTSGLQHLFVGVDPGSIVTAPGFTGNGYLVGLALGEIHRTNLFPLPEDVNPNVAGYELNTFTPTIDVTFSCSSGFFQGQLFLWFSEF